MAKYGEGDNRWIVEERPDGTNVHNWHLAETDCLNYSRSLFTSLLSDLPLLSSPPLPSTSPPPPSIVFKARPTSTSARARSSPDDGEFRKRCRDAMAKEGKEMILEKVRVYVESMAKDGPVKDDSNTRISREVGGEITVFDGSVTGSNVELQEGKLIVQKWRFGNWPDGVVSTVKLAFEEPEPGVTVIRLTHSDIPEEDRYDNATVAENTERGWRNLTFHRIRAVFGFGI
ncbi:hypothetical protein MLD38_021417 [Melastoma candidum]|uniref:Uncharacterized protein n=1 Tax=Melastoma candidum TaxID=119954 RepID=A0ACB9QGZ6_9MYRT|nr:hypothetical protein MLD38_021417 [Melastoma candidum]